MYCTNFCNMLYWSLLFYSYFLKNLSVLYLSDIKIIFNCHIIIFKCARIHTQVNLLVSTYRYFLQLKTNVIFQNLKSVTLLKTKRNKRLINLLHELLHKVCNLFVERFKNAINIVNQFFN